MGQRQGTKQANKMKWKISELVKQIKFKISTFTIYNIYNELETTRGRKDRVKY